MIDAVALLLLAWTAAGTFPPTPALSDVERLPAAEEARAALEIAGKAVEVAHPAVRAEFTRRRDIWYWIEQARHEWHYDDPGNDRRAKLEALVHLRRLVGYADYYGGRWPPPLPTELFVEVP